MRVDMRWSCLGLLWVLCVAVGCKRSIESDVEFGKAKAILWVDYKKERKITKVGSVRSVKVYAQVYADGSLKVLSWCKKQPMEVEDYLLKRVEVYRIRKEIFDGGYLKSGKQYLQLRYLPGEIR